MSSTGTSYQEVRFQKALREYLNLRRNVDPKREIRRRAKNVGLRLVKIYKEKGVKLETITAKVKSLGNRVRIRAKIRAKTGTKWNQQRRIAAELRARRSAKGFTSTGWFPAVEKLGGNPKRPVRPGTGPKRGKLIENLSGYNLSETLVNAQPGASLVQQKNKTLEQTALDLETADMVKYIARKQNEVARRAGL